MIYPMFVENEEKERRGKKGREREEGRRKEEGKEDGKKEEGRENRKEERGVTYVCTGAQKNTHKYRVNC